MRNLYEVLVIALANIAVVFPVWIVADNKCYDIAFEAIRNDMSCHFIEVITNLIVTLDGELCLLIGCTLDSLLVFDGLQLVVPLVQTL